MSARDLPGPELEAMVLDGVRRVAATYLDWHQELPLDAALVEDLELDSIRLLTLATEVENHFRIILEPEDENAIVTVGDLVRVVAGKLQHRGGAVSGSPPPESTDQQ